MSIYEEENIFFPRSCAQIRRDGKVSAMGYSEEQSVQSHLSHWRTNAPPYMCFCKNNHKYDLTKLVFVYIHNSSRSLCLCNLILLLNRKNSLKHWSFTKVKTYEFMALLKYFLLTD